MPDVRFRLYFDDRPATAAQLDRVEDVTVEQEIDLAWEARVQLPIRTSATGEWIGVDDDFGRAFGRVRVELAVGAGGFVPLIDGPIVATDTDMSAEPGRSMMTLVVHDDSVLLHRDDDVAVFENRRDDEIVRQLFATVPAITPDDIAETRAAAAGLPPIQVQRGTAMELLRRLAQRHGMHAYVLPGNTPGRSRGVFKPLPTQTDGLAPLVLLGPERNIASFAVKDDAQTPARTRAFAVNAADAAVVSGSSDSRQAPALGTEAAGAGTAPATRLLPPDGDAAFAAERAEAAATTAGFSYTATGSVAGNCYPGVLAPYRVIAVLGANARLSGDWVIRRVTHQLTRSAYVQSFALTRNARSGGANRSAPTPAAGIL